MNGVSSQPPGMPVARNALGGVSSQPPGRRISIYALQPFGDVTTDPAMVTTPTLTDPQWAKDLVASQREMTAWQAKWVTEDKFRRYIQIAATLSIPLAAAIWRAIGLGRRPT